MKRSGITIPFECALLASLTSAVDGIVSVPDSFGFDFGGTTLAGFKSVPLAIAWAAEQSRIDFRVFRVFSLSDRKVVAILQHGEMIEGAVNDANVKG